MEVYNLDGSMIYYKTFGNINKPPLVMLHGNGEDHSLFNSQISRFETDFFIIAIDTRGHGKSTGIPINFNQMADDTLAVISELNIKKAHFLGFSDGAIQALHIAIKVPESVCSLILVGVNITPDGLRANIRIYLLFNYLLLSIKALLKPSKWTIRKKIWSLMIFHPHIGTSALQNINCPTLVVAGENDMIKFVHTQLIAKSIPQSEMVIIAEADHFLTIDKPEVFNNIVAEFLKNVTFGRSST